jgi:hypothetical protein
MYVDCGCQAKLETISSGGASVDLLVWEWKHVCALAKACVALTADGTDGHRSAQLQYFKALSNLGVTQKVRVVYGVFATRRAELDPPSHSLFRCALAAGGRAAGCHSNAR